MVSKRTLVLGASEKSDRYSNMATKLLLKKGHQVYALGNRKGVIDGLTIDTQPLNYSNIHTITLYLNPKAQIDYYQYILSLKPERIIFNPGTENDELKTMAEKAGITTEYACTLVLLNLNQY